MIRDSLKDINNLEKSADCWWFVLFLRPLVNRLTWVISNFSRITPNQLTLISFIIGLFSSILFLQGEWIFLFFGAICFEVSYIFDCIDGRVARIKKISSPIGAYFDIMTDSTKYFFIITCLVFGQYFINKDYTIILYGLFFIFLTTINFISNFSIKLNSIKINTNIINNKNNDIHKKNTLFKFKSFLNKKHLLARPTSVEAETIALFIAPIILQIKIGLILGSIILLINLIINVYYEIYVKQRLTS